MIAGFSRNEEGKVVAVALVKGVRRERGRERERERE